MENQPMDSEWIFYGEGLHRFLGRKEMYHKYLKRFLEAGEFTALCDAMRNARYEDAFHCAHTLKGNAGNLSLTKFYRALCEITEALRNGADLSKAQGLMKSLSEIYQQTTDRIRMLLT